MNKIVNMNPVHFEGAQEIKKPESMTDEECFSIPALVGVDTAQNIFFLTAWKPSYEDLKALNRGEPVYVKTLSNRLPPMMLFTMDENNQCNES